MWQWILESAMFCIKCESLLFRFLLRTRILRVMMMRMMRMIQPSVRCVAEVTVRIACCCVMAVMQGKKGWNECSTWIIADGTAGLARVWSTGTIWSVGCLSQLFSGSSCGRICIHVLIVQTSPSCDRTFSGHVAASVWKVLHMSVLQFTEQVMKLFVLIHATSECKKGEKYIPFISLRGCMTCPSWLSISTVWEQCLFWGLFFVDRAIKLFPYSCSFLSLTYFFPLLD